MCHTNSKQCTVCNHVHTHVKPCSNAGSSSNLLAPTTLNPFKQLHYALTVLKSCHPTFDSVHVYELCHNCRLTFTRHGVDEHVAMARYSKYRIQHDYVGKLSPVLIGGPQSQELILVPDDQPSTPQSGKSMDSGQTITVGWQGGMIDVEGKDIGNGAALERSVRKLESAGSNQTLWPVAEREMQPMPSRGPKEAETRAMSFSEREQMDTHLESHHARIETWNMSTTLTGRGTVSLPTRSDIPSTALAYFETQESTERPVGINRGGRLITINHTQKRSRI